MIFFDTESCGFHGPCTLIQWAEDEGPITLHEVWYETAQSTIDLIEMIVEHQGGVCGFNLVHDWFHICQQYSVLQLIKDKNEPLYLFKDEYAIKEEQGRDGVCLKPVTALDLMLHARKGPYQSTMRRRPITLKKVPSAIAYQLAVELTNRIYLKDIYFTKQQDKKKRWTVQDIKDDLGNIIPDFKDITLKFNPSSGLKALAEDAFDVIPVHYGDIEPPEYSKPAELGYAPYCTAIGTPENWNDAWPDRLKIDVQIPHWHINERAREYAMKDVLYLQMLYKYFGEPEAGDVDSILACMVGAVRWKGFRINVDKIKILKAKAEKALEGVAINYGSPAVCRKYLEAVLSETERLALVVNDKVTTGGVVLEEIQKWKKEEVCEHCYGDGCDFCEDGLIITDEPHPAALRAAEILTARRAKKEIENYDKLILAGRFHANLNVIGTKSSRMSGSGGLNAQGMKREKEFRSCFDMAWPGQDLSAGDFDGQEVTIMDATYGDPVLREDLMTKRTCTDCNGKGCEECDGTGETLTKIHALFGQALFSGMSYEDIIATKGLPNEQDKYARSKNGVFALAYGGDEHTLVTRVGIDEDTALEGYDRFISRYIVWGQSRKKIFDDFCSMRQPGGIGTRVVWKEPKDFVESMLGFKRYFTLENRICRELFDLANDIPDDWKKIPFKVVRRDREQSVSGAMCSALYAAAFNIQSQNMRAAANHEIQSPGGELTKRLQERLWELQPAGISEWVIQLLNVHDEIVGPMSPKVTEQSHRIVEGFISEYKKIIPLLSLKWKSHLNNWGEK